MVQDEQSVIEKLPDDSFQSIFWRQQGEAAEKHPKAMRWHPLTIHYLRHISGKAYETIRESNCNCVPSQRTTHIAFNPVLVSVIKLMVNFVQLLS